MKNKGFTFIDVIVGVSLMLIVFLGVFGAYQLGMKVVRQSRNKITATAIGNEWLERIRNLPYGQVGTIGAAPSPPYPVGVLESATSTILNNIQYDVAITIKYIADETDGLASPEDECPNDYKRAEVKVSWSGLLGGEVVLSTDIVPKNLFEECETSGGILLVRVFDAYGKLVSDPLIEIRDPVNDDLIDSYTPSGGVHAFPLATSTYKVVVSKPGYSIERTYGIDEIAIPEKPHPIVLEGQLTEISFSIDILSTFSVNTLSPWGTDYFSDSFDDQSKVSEKSNLIFSDGKVTLATSVEGYLSSGYLMSIAITPSELLNWEEFSFSDSEPANTDLKYQIYYASDTDWYLIPDSNLPGNSQGFDLSPLDLSGLDVTKYSSLKLRANFSTTDQSLSPTLDDWQLSWKTTAPTPISDVTFNLEGAKIIGLDSNEDPVYKYSATFSSDATGHIDIVDLEWDSYTFSLDPATGLDLVDSEPPQPVDLPPNTTLSVDLYLEAQNSLLVTVQDSESLEPIFSASTTLSSPPYQKTQYTDEKGQTYFIPLDEGSYHLAVSAEGYLATSTMVSVTGDKTETIKLELAE